MREKLAITLQLAIFIQWQKQVSIQLSPKQHWLDPIDFHCVDKILFLFVSQEESYCLGMTWVFDKKCILGVPFKYVENDISFIQS